MYDPFIIGMGVGVGLWAAGYIWTVLKLRSFPGFPIDYRTLAVTWPLTLLGIYALSGAAVVEELEEETDGTEWQSFDELLRDE